jgi:pimeloyl-ACP methyl ester carboxylesterase
MEVEPFTIRIPDSALSDLHARLDATRFADDYDNDDWSYGVSGAYLKELIASWRRFDWRAQEALMNELPQFRATVDDVPIHFVHLRGRGRRVVPIILSHGWPWTFWDWRDVVLRLADPAAYGLDDGLAFDVVVPSLPGLAFSGPLRRSDIGAQETADLWVTLMAGLGYDRFCAAGGDWGAVVTLNLAHAHADRVLGVHVSPPFVPGFASTPCGPEDYGPDEADWHERTVARMATTQVHKLVQAQQPQTLAWALNDSPLGLAAWLVQRRRDWSDCGGDVESAFSRDFLLATFSLYWFTQTSHSAARFYAVNARIPWQPRHDRQPVLEAPVAVAVMPQDVLLLPRRFLADHANLVRWTVMPRGGHFSAAEQPQLIADDIAAFFAGQVESERAKEGETI